MPTWRDFGSGLPLRSRPPTASKCTVLQQCKPLTWWDFRQISAFSAKTVDKIGRKVYGNRRGERSVAGKGSPAMEPEKGVGDGGAGRRAIRNRSQI
jgi:hypothetical protein